MPNQYTKQADIIKQNKNEIKWNIINSLISGALVFIGASIAELQDHGFSNPKELLLGIFLGIGTASIVALTKFKSYWEGEQKEYSKKIFKFL